MRKSVWILLMVFPVLAWAYSDDSTLHVVSEATALQYRQAMITYAWGTPGWPTGFPTITTGIANPITGLSNHASTDQWQHDMTDSQSTLCYKLNPTVRNNRLVIVQHGHACSFSGDDATYRMHAVIDTLMADGFDVLACFMINNTPSDCSGSGPHDTLMNTVVPANGHPIKYFIENVIVAINQAMLKSPRYQDVSMVGLSGGGWTTHWLAAMDTRIRNSVPVAGSLPNYLKGNTSSGYDAEQYADAVYAVAGWLDLFAMGGWGTGRQSVQVLNTNDSCCFGSLQYTLGATAWRNAVNAYQTTIQTPLGSTQWRWCEDTVADQHQISTYAQNSVLMPLLLGGTICP